MSRSFRAYMSAASSSAGPSSNQIQVLLSLDVSLTPLTSQAFWKSAVVKLGGGAGSSLNNSFSRPKLWRSKEQGGRGGEVTSLSAVSLIPVSVWESEWISVCAALGAAKLSAPPSFLPLQSKSPCTSGTHTHTALTPPLRLYFTPLPPPEWHLAPLPPPPPSAPKLGCRTPESHMTCPHVSHALFSLFFFHYISLSSSRFFFCTASQTTVFITPHSIHFSFYLQQRKKKRGVGIPLFFRQR